MVQGKLSVPGHPTNLDTSPTMTPVSEIVKNPHSLGKCEIAVKLMTGDHKSKQELH